MSTFAQVFTALETIKGSVGKVKVDPSKVKIEDAVFQLFSKLTVALLLGCSILVTMNQLFGDHIKCIVPPKEDIRPQPLHQYCFIMSTYTVPKYYNRTIGTEVAHYGVGPHDPEEDEERFHNYYQWVPFVLFFQAIFFMAPHFLWKSIEGKKMNTFCNLELADKVKFNAKVPLGFKTSALEDTKNKKIRWAAEYFHAYINHNHVYSYTYILCETLNFVVVVLNIYMVDSFLGNQFSNYGPDVVNFLSKDPEVRNDPLSRVFPKVTKCDFRKFGPSGTLMRYDILCILALNIINEKIYTFLWFWFILLSCAGGIKLIFRLLFMFVPAMRNYVVRRKGHSYMDKAAIDFITSKIDYCDWFIFYRISENINSIRFVEFCRSLAQILGEKDGDDMRLEKKPLMEEKRKDADSDDEKKHLYPLDSIKEG